MEFKNQKKGMYIGKDTKGTMDLLYYNKCVS